MANNNSQHYDFLLKQSGVILQESMEGKSKKDFSEYSDLQLFKEVARREAVALSILYDRHSPRLYGLALKILKDQVLAEDALQETFLNIWNKAEQFDKSRGTPLSWMMILCRNRCIDKLRAKEKLSKRVAELDESTLQTAELMTIETIDHNELQNRITQALHQLPEEQRVTIEMAYFEGFSQSEIADQLQLPLGTIKTRIRLGMQKLRDIMKKHWDN